MAVAKDYQKVGGPFGNQTEIKRVTYDFSKDGGAVSVIDLFVLEEDTAIMSFYANVKTACTSGGSATVEAGIKGGDTDAFMAATAVASLTEGALINSPATHPYKVASAAVVSAEIKVAALTAGKIEFVVEVAKF